MKYAGFFTRFFALLIDIILMGILVFILTFIFGGMLSVTSSMNSGLMNFLGGVVDMLFFILMLFFQFFYFGYFWSKDGQSLGMKMLNIQVVGQDGQPLSFLRAGLRGSVGYWISGFIFSLGFIWAAFDAKKEAWHDKLFKTWVVRA